MKRVFAAALALLALASFVGSRSHVVTGELRILLPIGYENRLPFARTLTPTVPRVDYMGRVQAATDRAFTNIVMDETLMGSVNMRDALPLVVPAYDGHTDFQGTSGYVTLDVISKPVSFTYDGRKLFWRLVSDGATVFSQGFDTLDPRLGQIDTSHLTGL